MPSWERRQLAGFGKWLFGSTVLSALLLIILFDAWLRTAHPLQYSPTPSKERGEVFQGAKFYRSLSMPPDVVLLGSSLVTAPVMQAEAMFLGKPVSRTGHRNCLAIDDMLGKKLHYRPDVISLASGGQMISDAYLITKHLLRGEQQPAAIVYGVAPRDFCDNYCHYVDSTETFQTIANLDDLPDALCLQSLPLDRRIDLILGRVSGIWRYKDDLRKYAILRSKKMIQACLPFPIFQRIQSDGSLKYSRWGMLPEEAKGTPQATPGVALDHMTPGETSSEYLLRYNPLRKNAVETQNKYLQKLITLCKARNIALLLVNMPLSEQNKALMPPGFYADYLNRLQELSKQNEIELADLDRAPWSDNANFVDTVHLKPEMSRKFLSALCDEISTSSISLAARAHAVDKTY